MNRYVVAAVVVLAAIGWRVQDVRWQRRVGAAHEQLKTISAERDTLRVVKDSLAAASTAQVETLRVSVFKRSVIRDTVERWLRDTVPVPVEVVREIVRVDSVVIHACMVALGTCQAEKAALTADLRLTERQRDAFKRLVPSGFQSTTRTVRDIAIGWGLKAVTDALLGRGR